MGYGSGLQYPGIWISISNPTKSVAMMKVCSDCNPSDGITKPISLNQVQQILSYSSGPTMPTSVTRCSQMSDYLQPLSTTSPSAPYISTSSQYPEYITTRQRPSTSSPSSPYISTLSQYLKPVPTCQLSSSYYRPYLYTHEFYSQHTSNCILKWIRS